MKLKKYVVNELICIGERVFEEGQYVYATDYSPELGVGRKFFDADHNYIATESISEDLLTEQ